MTPQTQWPPSRDESPVGPDPLGRRVRTAGMAAAQVPVPERSVPLGRVAAPGRPEDPAAPVNGATAPAGPAEQPAGGTGRATGGGRRTGRATAPAGGRLRRGVLPLVLVVLCAVLAGAAVHRITGTGTGPAAAAPVPVSDSPAASAAPEPDGEGAAGDPLPGAAPGEPAPAPTAPPAPAPAPVVTEEIVLRWGDTLSGLARRHRTTVRALQDLNGLGESTLIRAGAVLRVPRPAAGTPGGGSTTATTATDTVPAADTGADTRPWTATDTSDTGPGSRGPADPPGTIDLRTPPRDDTTPATGPGPRPKKDTAPGKDTTPGQDADRRRTAARGAAAAVAFARAQLGKPYAWGATGPRSFDCSGLVMRAWQAGGVRLPRTTWDMAGAGTATTRKALVPGDLLITNGGGHVQLYIGDGKVVHAPGRGRHVTVAPLAPASDVVTYRHLTPHSR
ncbi:NlpC/P60 family protein [Kitasatospora sp. NPDC056327]|uniref:C40 family peptidase n=1 Tax=Kitasatospora sp. NPDC056327 TaxID=3345785 RepID=UPI0035DC7317